MKQSPLRPCYLDVSARRPHDAPGLRRTSSAIETTPRFPVGPLGSGSGPGAGESTATSISDTKLNGRANLRPTTTTTYGAATEDVHRAPHDVGRDDRLSTYPFPRRYPGKTARIKRRQE